MDWITNDTDAIYTSYSLDLPAWYLECSGISPKRISKILKYANSEQSLYMYHDPERSSILEHDIHHPSLGKYERVATTVMRSKCIRNTRGEIIIGNLFRHGQWRIMPNKKKAKCGQDYLSSHSQRYSRYLKQRFPNSVDSTCGVVVYNDYRLISCYTIWVNASMTKKIDVLSECLFMHPLTSHPSDIDVDEIVRGVYLCPNN